MDSCLIVSRQRSFAKGNITIAPQLTCRAFPASPPPFVFRRSIAFVTGVGFPPDEVNQRFTAQTFRELPGIRLVFPHQGGFNLEPAVHPRIERCLKAPDRFVPAIRIAGKIRFAHAANYVLDPQLVRKRCRYCQEYEIAPGYEGRRQA